jgi:hypothetical protein
MIRKFSYTSNHLVGEVLLWYTSDGLELLVMFDVSRAEMEEKQLTAFLQNLPRCFEDLKRLVAMDSVNRDIQEYFDNVTFEGFWERYDHKRLSSKIKTVKIWEKMSDSEKCKAFAYIDRYENDLRRSGGIAKKHAETYLNAGLWNN